MRAIRIHGFGGIDTMRLDEIPRPVPGAGEVLVAVKAAGVGLWDRLMREGRISQTLPVTLVALGATSRATWLKPMAASTVGSESGMASPRRHILAMEERSGSNKDTSVPLGYPA